MKTTWTTSLRSLGLSAAIVTLMSGGVARAADEAPQASAKTPAYQAPAAAARLTRPGDAGTGSATASEAPEAQQGRAPQDAARAASGEARRIQADAATSSTLSEDSRSDAFASPSLR